MTRRPVTDVALLIAASIGAAAIGRLTVGGGSWRGVVATTVVGTLVPAIAARRLTAAWSLALGVVTVTVTALSVSEPRARWHGLPSLTSLRDLDHSLQMVGAVHFPLTSTPGVVVIASLAAGMMAVATRVLPGTAGLLPAVVILAAGPTVALPSRGAGLLAVALAAAGTAIMVVRSAERLGSLVGAAATAAAALCVVVVGVAGGSAMASGGGRQVEGVPPTALSLTSRLTALQIHDAKLVMFRAATPLPTYWQIGSLSVLADDSWVPDASTAAALAGRSLSVSPSAPFPGPVFTVKITIDHLSSRLLPVPPSTTAVSEGLLTPAGALATGISTSGQQYEATATVPQTDLSGEGGETLPGASAPDVADTRLPTLPPTITALARSVTASASTPLERAEALTNWFRSSLFHYSLQSSNSGLVSFLTTSHTGSCEQFAGAFAVLARAIGLPTRVAIGFTTGVRAPGGATVVRGIDAHAWPQVFLAGTWVSFEPTPARPSGEISPPGVIGLTGAGTPNPVVATTLPTSTPTSIPPATQPTTAPTLPLSQTPPSSPTTVSRSSDVWRFLLPAGAAVVVLLVGLLLWWRRRRQRTPDEEVRLAWRRADRALRRSDNARPPWRTPVVHSELLRTQNMHPEIDDVFGELRWLAASLEALSYGSGVADTADAARARAASRQVTKTLR